MKANQVFCLGSFLLTNIILNHKPAAVKERLCRARQMWETPESELRFPQQVVCNHKRGPIVYYTTLKLVAWPTYRPYINLLETVSAQMLPLLTPLLTPRRCFYLARWVLHMDLFLRNVHHKFSASIGHYCKPKSQHPAKQTREKGVLAVSVETASLQRRGSAGLLPSQVAMRWKGRIFLLFPRNHSAAQVHQMWIWVCLNSYRYLWEGSGAWPGQLDATIFNHQLTLRFTSLLMAPEPSESRLKSQSQVMTRWNLSLV